MLCMYNSIFGRALLWDRTTILISRRDESKYYVLCYVKSSALQFSIYYSHAFMHA